MQIVSEPSREKKSYDDTDRHLMAALQSVEVPGDLRSRLERSLLAELRAQDPHSLPVEQATKTNRNESPVTRLLWNRRTAISAAIAAGIGGIALGFRQIWQPLTQSQLVAITQKLLSELEKADWQVLSDADAVAVKRSLQDVGFLRQVGNVSLVRVTHLQSLRSVQRVTAYKFDKEFVLLDLTIERGVQRVSHVLNELPWNRSDTVAFAMSAEDRTLVFAGPAILRHHILPAQTT